LQRTLLPGARQLVRQDVAAAFAAEARASSRSSQRLSAERRTLDPMEANSPSVAVTQAFLDELNDIAGIHAMALTGIIKMAEFAATLRAPRPDSTFFVGHGDPNSEEGFAYQHWPIRSLRERLGPDGPVVRALGQQWIVMVASKWNDHYRALIADALGIETNELKDAAMADINRMRNDIVHHRGIATARNTGRCEVLRWFAEGEPIHVLPVHVSELVAYFGGLQVTREIGGSAVWRERYESASSTDPTLGADGAVFTMLVQVCGHLPEFIDDGTWEPSTPLETLIVECVSRGRLMYETIVELASSGTVGQAALLASSLFEEMAVANWLVLHSDNPDWLLEQFADHRDALRLYEATRRDSEHRDGGDANVSDLDGREDELRRRFGSSAERPWWGIDRDGSPLSMPELVERLAAAELFHPRLRGEKPVLEEQYATQRIWAQALQHMPTDTRPGEASPEPSLGAPNAVVVLFSSYWVFGQLIHGALEIGAPAVLAHFERLFLAGLAVFGEAVGSPVPWADQLATWVEEQQERAEQDVPDEAGS
jgi:hypothetical protein